MKKFLLLVFSIAAVFCASASWADILIDDGVKPEGYVGQYYEADIHVNCNDVNVSYSYGLSGTLPDGLSWNDKGSGWLTIYGTPKTAGTYKFEAFGTNSLGVGSSKQYTVVIKDKDGSGGSTQIETKAPRIYIGSGFFLTNIYDEGKNILALRRGVVGKFYSTTIDMSNKSVSYSLEATGLPDGLTARAYDSFIDISGTPTKAGTYQVKIKVFNSVGSDTRTFPLTIKENQSSPIITSYQIHNGTVGTEYLYTKNSIRASGKEPIKIECIKGSLPWGLKLSDNESGSGIRLISGWPAVLGTYNFTIRASNSEGYYDEDFAITIFDNEDTPKSKDIPPHIEGNSYYGYTLPKGVVGNRYGAEYGILYDFKIYGSTLSDISISGLPDGLEVDYKTFDIYGTPTKAGKYQVKVTASNSAGTDTKTFPLIIEENDPVIDYSLIKNGIVGESYSSSFHTSGEFTNWEVINGSLPPGLKLAFSRVHSYGHTTYKEYTIEGTPRQAGKYDFTIRLSKYGGYYDEDFSITILDNLEQITTKALLAEGKVGNYYTDTLTADGVYLSWSVSSGSLPDGLSIKDYYTISGIPTKSGTYNFTLQAKAGYSGKKYITRDFTIKINDPAPIANVSITKNSISNGKIGTPYSDTLTANSTGIFWTVVVGSLPSGLYLNASTGEISGTPAQTGTFEFFVTAEKGSRSDLKSYTLTITDEETPAAPVIVSITKSSLSNGKVGTAYSDTLTANISDVTWSVGSGSLPDGLKLNASTGAISGTPTKGGTFDFTIKATKGAVYTTKPYTIKIEGAASSNITITTTSLPDGRVGRLYMFSVSSSASGVTWSVSSGNLPDGFQLSAVTGLILGRPTKSGTYTFTIKAASGTDYATKEYTIKIENSASTVTVSITKTSLSRGKVGTAYSDTLTSNTSGVTWSISSGTFPSDLTLDKSTGKISGTPKNANTYNFTVRATHTSGSYAEKSYTLTIEASASIAKPVIKTTKLKAGKVDKKYTPKVKASGKNITWSASGLPAGVEINPSTGKFSGLPENSGTYNVRVTAANGGGSDTKTFSVVIKDIKPNIKGKAKTGKVGNEYLAEFYTTKGTGNITWTLTPDNLPEGLEYDYDTEGATIEGVPEETWKQKYTLTATNSAGSKTKKFTLKIKK